jgi:hypothetical protein
MHVSLEAAVSGPRDEIEFRFARFGGNAKGRFAIIVFAVLIALALIATMILWWRITSVGIAYYDHLDSPQSRAMTKPFYPPLEGYGIHTYRRLQPCLMAWNWVRPRSMTMGPGFP